MQADPIWWDGQTGTDVGFESLPSGAVFPQSQTHKEVQVLARQAKASHAERILRDVDWFREEEAMLAGWIVFCRMAGLDVESSKRKPSFYRWPRLLKNCSSRLAQVIGWIGGD